jgi:putative PIG3 family NAD(P)H quinone oxidoreductase
MKFPSTDLPNTMHAVECQGFGGPEVMRWVERPVPAPAQGEALIKVAAAGLNRADTMQRQGRYPPPAGASDIMGMEVSGEIVALGEGITRWKPGDKIIALLSGGGYAEYAVAKADQCLPLPENVSMQEGAALIEAIVTVYANVFEAGALKPHETILVHGGSSGIGTTAIQMVKCLGAKIFVTVSNEEKAEACRKLGVDLVVDYKKQDFVTATNDATGGQGVDVVLDMVGGDYIERNLSVLASLGRHISIATQQGKSATIDMRLVMQKRLTITGSTLRARSDAEKARLIAEVEANIWPWVNSGGIKSLIYKSFPIKLAAEAHKMMESGAHIGKIILEVAA